MKPNEIDAVQMNNHQAQLEEAVGMMSQEIGTIKELLKRLFVPQASTTTRGDDAVEELCAEQQATKTTTMEQCRAFRRGPWHHQDHRRKCELEEDQSQLTMCSTDSARMLRKICAFT